MIFEVDKRNFEIIIASDVQRDGLGAELWDKEKNDLIAEIFRNDDLKTVSFYCEKCNLPFEVIEKLIKEFDKRVGRTFND